MGYMEFIRECQDDLVRAYPELKIRWARIYGKRWAYLYGNSSDVSCQAPLKIEINQDYGLCIDNNGIISVEELDKVVATIKERFSHVDMV